MMPTAARWRCAEVARQTLGLPESGSTQPAAHARPARTIMAPSCSGLLSEENVLDQLDLGDCRVHSCRWPLTRRSLRSNTMARAGLDLDMLRAREAVAQRSSLYHIGSSGGISMQLRLPLPICSSRRRIPAENSHNGEYADAERIARATDRGQMQEAGEQHDKHQNKNTANQSLRRCCRQQLPHNTVNVAARRGYPPRRSASLCGIDQTHSKTNLSWSGR